MKEIIETVAQHWVATILIGTIWLLSLDIVVTGLYNIVVAIKTKK